MIGILKASPLAIFFFGLLLPLFALKDYWSQFSDSYDRLETLGQGVAVVGLVGLIFATQARRAFLIDRGSLVFVAPFLLWCLVSTLWSIAPLATAANFALLAVYLVALGSFWKASPATQRTLALYGAIAIWLGIVMLALFLAAGERSLGAVPPNLLGHYALVAMCLFMMHGRWKVVPALATLGLIGFSQARTVFVGFLVFWGAYLVIVRLAPKVRSRGFIIAMFTALGSVVAGLVVAGQNVFVQLVSDALNVTTASRLGTDFTGRAEVWQVAYDKILATPFMGYGFRTRQTADLTYVTDAINAHSGVLNVILDVGYIGLGFFALWYGFAVLRSLDTRPHPIAQERVVIASFLLGNIAILALEPNYISFGHPTSFMMLMALSFPFARFRKPAALPRRTPRWREALPAPRRQSRV